VNFGWDDDERPIVASSTQLVDEYGAVEMRAIREEIESHGAERHAESFHRKLADRGLLAIGLPDPHGRSATSSQRYALHEVLDAAGMPTYSLEINEGMAGMIYRHARPETAAVHLPKLLAGAWTYAGGYSEPEAGSDLLALRTRAVRDGDTYVVTGTKLWTSSGQLADWIVTIVRTDSASSRHHGLSVLLIDARSPGLTIDPVPVIGGWRVNAISYDEVRVPASNLLGDEHHGWSIITRALAAERTMSFGGRESRLLLARLVRRWAQSVDGVDPDDLATLGELVAELEIERLLNLRPAAMAERGEDASSEGSMSKVFGSELAQRTAHWLADVAPDAGVVDGELAEDIAVAERASTAFTIIGGTSEVQRNVIADRGLGLARR
jgi:alkylation response protein AidB-like acyl-CoA dehydrogenase